MTEGFSRAIWAEVAAERERAHRKHGATSMESAPADDPTGRRQRILMEEIGEVAREFNDAEHERRPVDLLKLRKELIQVAAMAGAWADVIDQQAARPLPPRPETCSQCAQRTPVCAECGDSIIYVPRSGFGNAGEWQHKAPPLLNVGAHMARPKLFIDPPPRDRSQGQSQSAVAPS